MNTFTNLFAIVLITTTFIVLALALAQTIRNDGHGLRPGPRSHFDPFDPFQQRRTTEYR